jgi:putative transposase
VPSASIVLGTSAKELGVDSYIERGSPWENGYVESFNSRLRDELLKGEIFTTLKQAQIVIED